MSGRSRRSDPKVYTKDYKVLHNTGERVYKPSPLVPDMDLKAKQLKER